MRYPKYSSPIYQIEICRRKMILWRQPNHNNPGTTNCSSPSSVFQLHGTKDEQPFFPETLFSNSKVLLMLALTVERGNIRNIIVVVIQLVGNHVIRESGFCIAVTNCCFQVIYRARSHKQFHTFANRFSGVVFSCFRGLREQAHQFAGLASRCKTKRHQNTNGGWPTTI